VSSINKEYLGTERKMTTNSIESGLSGEQGDRASLPGGLGTARRGEAKKPSCGVGG